MPGPEKTLFGYRIIRNNFIPHKGKPQKESSFFSGPATKRGGAGKGLATK